MESLATSSTASSADDIKMVSSPREAPRDWMNPGVTAATGSPAKCWLSTRKKIRIISGVMSKSQRKIRFFMVPAEVIKMTMAVRRLVCTN